jgi:archaellum component FlaF (FlaF/FlaG flagellin family)
MNDNDKNIIKDEKLIYLIKTLSRTRRKDYENYVINAIWNRLGNKDIEIVSQQYINNPNDERKHYFIDLYFPQLNIGIECDEAHHKDEDNKKVDKEREANIFDILSEINDDKYYPIHIDVTKDYLSIENDINNAVNEIKKKIDDVKPEKWQVEAEEYYKNKDKITVNDRMGFKTINKACNVLFSAEYKETKGQRGTCFSPKVFRNTSLKDHKLWFPKLAVKIMVDGEYKTIPVSKGWNNQINSDGTIITECNEEGNTGGKDDKKTRIVFMQYKDPLGKMIYRFVGKFKLSDADDNGQHIYIKISDECQLLKE